jgi:hypothetical protein
MSQASLLQSNNDSRVSCNTTQQLMSVIGMFRQLSPHDVLVLLRWLEIRFVWLSEIQMYHLGPRFGAVRLMFSCKHRNV